VKPYPKEIHVYWDGEDEYACLIAVEDVGEIPEEHGGETVATYDLYGTSELSITKELV
jgi:hypothetical protein